MGKTSKDKQTFTVTRTGGLSAGQRAAIYNRVSTVEQDPTKAIDDMRAATRQRGFEVALEIAETGSGKKNDRPGLLEVLAAARRGELDVVIVARLDRFGRSTMDLLQNIQILTDNGVRFLCTDQAIDIQAKGSPMSRLMLEMLAAIAQFEHGIITERVRDGVRRAKAKGVKFGRKRISGPSGAEVAGLRAGGLSWSQVAKKLGCNISLARARAAEFAA